LQVLYWRGLSTRMGADKAQLKLADQSLLAHSVALLDTLPLAKTFVSGHYEGYFSIPDVHPNLGPIGGLHACVKALYNEYDALFIIPVDMPLLDSKQCKILLNAFKKLPQGVFFNGPTFPLILPLNSTLQQYLSEVLVSSEKKQRSLYGLLEALKIQSVNYKEQAYFHFYNSNTPNEFQTCIELYKKLKIAND